MIAEKKVHLDQILLDPNNYRFHELGDYSNVPRSKYATPATQKRTMERLRSLAFENLKKSIIENGFVTVDRIVLEEFEDDKFVVIEGNRRIAALKSIQSDLAEGVLEDEKNLMDTIENVPCVVNSADDDGVFRLTLMGIRHVGGVNEWGGYQRAKLICDMMDTLKLESVEVADKIGLSVQEVNRRYRAFKALSQMKDDDDYSDFATPSLYPLFHEAVSQPTIREWLNWNPKTSTFENDNDREFFYSLMTPTEAEDGIDIPARVKTYSDVRSLKQVLMSEDAKAALYDEDQSFMNAVLIAKQSELSGKWRKEVREASNALKNISALDLDNLDEKDIHLLQRLRDAANKLLTQIEKISA
ncbi:MAG: ParB N-terminal domain-containing protein [Hyphomonadaceae bacterium]|nr:ParB N-terminal domain-containing protein [Hyphomonadaceae bacterium]